MKSIFFIITAATFLVAFSACKKGYTCACSSPDGFYDGFDIDDSKKRAAKKCDDYYKSQYESIPTNNVSCELRKGE